MTHRRLWIAAAIIALVVIGSFILFVPHVREVAQAPTLDTPAQPVPPVTLKDVFKKGVHTISGAVETPNACATLVAEATSTVSASGENRIQIVLKIFPDMGVCLQLPAIKNFSTTIAAPAHTPITVMVNGAAATTTVL